MNWKRFAAFAFALLAVVLLSYQPVHAQATVSTGNVTGTITDPQGAAVPTAKVTITNKDTGRTIDAPVNGAGAYSSGALTPGVYTVRVEAPSFKTIEDTVTVQVGVVSAANFKLELGAATTVVEVTGTAVAVNTEQAQVQGVLTAQQIENLPINGRNFLDLAQLEPGVQIQDGANFDPTKTGYSSISFGGRYGRTARIQVDGTDVSDETVGTTTTSIPASAISEFQLAQSSLDLSNDLTSSGAVNVVTKSGTNSVHGEAFGLFRDNSQAAAFPGGGTFQRSQYGGDVGGPIIKDKLFFFADGERTVQHAGAGVTPVSPFQSLAGTFPSPFEEADLLGKLDFQATKNLHIFARYSYFNNFLVPAFGTPSFQFFANKDTTRNEVVGADFSTGTFTHSIRFQYLKFQNQIADAVRGSGEPFADFPVAMTFATLNLATGPSPDAPQATPQSSHQIKYDGSKVLGTHILRYGVALNHIAGGGFASFFQFAPLFINLGTAGSLISTANNCGTTAGDASCPLNYATDDAILMGNGQGFASEKPAFGRPFGGLGPDNRFSFYVGDTWKILSNFTLNYGVRYVRDTGRTDSDLPPIPALNAVLPGFGNSVNQPNKNFGPQLGIAWDPWKNGKTVIRAGAGIFFDNSIFNNVLFDRPPRLQTGTFFFAEGVACGPSAVPNSFADGTVRLIGGGQGATVTQAVAANAGAGNVICGSAIGSTLGANAGNCVGETTATCVANFQSTWAGVAAANPLNPNPNYLGTEIAQGVPLSGVIAPFYKSPRSVQINVGIQRELRPGTVLSVDYLRNIGTHFLLGVDVNHTGDSAYFDGTAAGNAIAAVNGYYGCAINGTTITTLDQGIQCALTSPIVGPNHIDANGNPLHGAVLTDYGQAGLDSPRDIGAGVCSGSTVLPALPNAPRPSANIPCAFGGVNPNVGPTSFLEPVGKSVYNALDFKLTQNANHPFKGVKYLNFQFAYTLSRFVNNGSANGLGNPGTPANSDQDFIDTSLDFRDTGRFIGPNGLDRTHQFNFGGYADLPYGFRLGLVAHFWSPLAVTPLLDISPGPGSIFQTDFTGDGTVNDPLPNAQGDPTCGTAGGNCNYSTYKTGAYSRKLGPGSLGTAINNYNTAIANGTNVTPAGQVLINNLGISAATLYMLGAAPQAVPPTVPGATNLSWMKAADIQFSWVGHFWHERLTLTPSVGFYNAFNFVNYDPAGNTQSGALSGGAGSIGYTNANPDNRANRIGNGSGVYGLGAPRVIEWGLKLQF